MSLDGVKTNELSRSWKVRRSHVGSDLLGEGKERIRKGGTGRGREGDGGTDADEERKGGGGRVRKGQGFGFERVGRKGGLIETMGMGANRRFKTRRRTRTRGSIVSRSKRVPDRGKEPFDESG